MRITFVCSLLCAALASTTALAGQEETFSNSRDPHVFTVFAETDEICSGFVIINGEYLSRPYMLVRKDDVLFINNRPLPGGTSRTNQANEFPDLVERTLQNDGLLIANQDRVYLLASERGHRVLEALVSGTAAESMLANIRSALGDNFAATIVPWAVLVEFATQDAAFVQRLRDDLGITSASDLDFEVPPLHSMTQSLRFGMNAAGMALAVLALGTVLLYRPVLGHKEGNSDELGDGYKLLPRFVIVVLLMSMFDLVYTMTADRAGGLWEMNPLGSQLLQFPLALIAFKIGATLTGVGLLLRLRKYRTAQFASWCVCLVYTVLTFRWAIFNSLFFG